MKEKPTAEEVRQLLACDAATGRLFWKARTPIMFGGSSVRCKMWNSRYAGRQAGHLLKDGYRCVRIWNVSYLEHHIVWLIVHGEWPKQLDHRRGLEGGHGIANLRPADQSLNNANAKKRKDNKSGFKGVSWDKFTQKWMARIRVPGGKYENLGRYDNPRIAHAMYCVRAIQLYGEFARFE